MISWKNVKVGDAVTYEYNDFDGHGIVYCYISSVHNDHAIAMDADAIRYWVDADTQHMFSKGWA